MGKITIRESSSDPDTPSAGDAVIFARSDNSVQVRDETGATRQLDGGAVAGDVESLSTSGDAGEVPTSDGAGGLAMDTPWTPAITAHEAAGNPHTAYQLAAEKDQASGYAGLDGSSLIAGAQLPYGTGVATVCEGNDARLVDARAPTGVATGDLAGAYNTGPIVAQIQGQPVSATAPTAGQIMVFDGNDWVPQDQAAAVSVPGPPGHVATAFTSVQDGPWTDPQTWGHPLWYPHGGDTAVILHDVTLDGNQQVGDGTIDVNPFPGTDAVLRIEDPGSLTMADNSSLRVHGDSWCDTAWAVGAGCTLTFTEDSEIMLWKGPSDIGGMTVRGTASNRTTITCPTEGAHFYITASADSWAGDCRVDMEYCDISNFGSDTYVDFLRYHQVGRGANLPWRLSNVTCTNCTRLRSGGLREDHDPSTGVVIIEDFAHVSPRIPAVPPGNWATFETYSRPGMTFRMDRVYFEGRVALLHCDGVEIEDFVFGDGILRFTNVSNLNNSGSLAFARRGIVVNRGQSGGASRYGDTWEDVMIIASDATERNAHFTNVGGDVGEALFRRCIFWGAYSQASPATENDLVISQNAASGTQATNRVRLERCLVPANANGFGNLNAAGGSLSTNLSGFSNATVQIDRCTVYCGRLGAVHIGETIQAVAGSFEYMRNSLVVGYSADPGDMIRLLNGGAQQDTLIAAETRYNGKFNIDPTIPSPGSGSGYNIFSYSGSDVIGANDSEGDPAFVDPSRTPYTYAGGSDLDDLIAQVRANWDVVAAVDYMFAGYTPTNLTYQNAGDPADGSPDIGCADF